MQDRTVITGMFETDILGRQVPLEVCHWNEKGRNPTHINRCPTELFNSNRTAEQSFLTEQLQFHSFLPCSPLVNSLPSSWNLGSFPGHRAWFGLIFVCCYYL